MKRILLAITVLMGIGLPAASGAMTLDLLDGRSWIGDVVLMTETEITFHIQFPISRLETVDRADVAPRSLYDLLSSRLRPDTAPTRMELSRVAEELGLYGHAIADLRRAETMDPALQDEVRTRVEGLEDRLAEEVMRHAREAMDDGDWATAKLNAQAVLDVYPRTKLVRDAKKLLGEIMKEMSATAKKESRPPQAIAKVASDLKEIDARLAKAAEYRERARSSSGSKQRRSLDQASRVLEGAWTKVEKLPTLQAGSSLMDRAEGVRASVQSALHDVYVEQGNLFVKRLALPSAEAVNAKACRLDPESGGCKQLQGLIIQARIATGRRIR